MAQPPDNPNYGQTFTKGVKYIKIHSLDKDGENYGPQLALADNIKINYPDIGSVQYNILTTQQQGDYYLMGVIPNETTSSINSIKDYDIFLAKSPLSVTLDTWDTAVWNDDYNGGLIVVGGNNGGYYNYSTDVYSFNFPNTPLSITSSLQVSSVSGFPVLFTLLIPSSSVEAWIEGIPVNQWEANGVQLLNIININNGSGGYVVSSSVTDNIGGEYYFGIVNVSLFGGSCTLISIYEEINQGSGPDISSDEVLLNIQAFVSNFEYSDYNAVFGNATIPQFSTIYQDIDYNSNGGFIPTNFNLIISGTAAKAQIQDSNYTQKGWINGRYNGSKNSSIDFNQ